MSDRYSKETAVAGCKVRLEIQRQGDRWTADVTLFCGAGDQTREERFVTEAQPTAAAAEQVGLERVGKLIGAQS